MSLVRDVIEVVTRTAEKHHVKAIAEINMTIGQGRDVVPELFDGVFRYLSAGTVAENAELIVTNTPYMARCEDCGCVYPINPMVDRTLSCPQCGARHYKVVSGLEFRIDSIKVAPTSSHGDGSHGAAGDGEDAALDTSVRHRVSAEPVGMRR